LLQVRVTLEDMRYVIRFRREPPVYAPYLVENRTLSTLYFRQEGVEGAWEALLPYNTCAYAWDEPMQRHALEMQCQAQEDVLRREPLGSYTFVPTQGVVAHGNKRVVVATKGPIRVLQVVDAGMSWAVETREHHGAAMPDAGTGPSRAQPKPGEFTLDLELSVGGIGLSLINATPEELLYGAVNNVQVVFQSHGLSSRLNVSVATLQIDNQLASTQSPVMLWGQSTLRRPSLSRSSSKPGGLRGSVGGAISPQLDVVVVQDNRFGHRISFIERLHINSEPLHLRIDGNLVAALIRIGTSMGREVVDKSSEQKKTFHPHVATLGHSGLTTRSVDVDKLLGRAVDLDAILRRGDGGVEEDRGKVFVDTFEIGQIRLFVSFSASFMISRVLAQLISSNESGPFPALQVVLDAVGSTLSKVENAPLRFSALEVKHAYSTELGLRLVQHYSREAIKQAYLLLGTLDVLGNPIGLVANLSAGVRDFLYEPARGLGKGTPWHFGLGLYRGSVSLLSRLSYSCLDTLQSFASSLHAGLLPLVLITDEDPRSALQGSIRGLLRGMGDMIGEPLSGMRAGGLAGFRRGLIRGMVGMTVRPVLGGLQDLIEVCQLGMERLQPHLSLGVTLTRLRPRRIFKHPAAALKVYSREDTEVEQTLSRLLKGQFWHEGYLWYCYGPDDQVVIVTRRRVLLVRLIGTTCILDWHVHLRSLILAELGADGRGALPTVTLHFLLRPLDSLQPTGTLAGEPHGQGLAGLGTGRAAYWTAEMVMRGLRSLVPRLGAWSRSHRGFRFGHRAFELPSTPKALELMGVLRQLVGPAKMSLPLEVEDRDEQNGQQNGESADEDAEEDEAEVVETV
jgi:vacuolar protein sorting-associated protein 13A/C